MDYKWIQLEGWDLLVLNDSRVLLYEPKYNGYKFIKHSNHGGGYVDIYFAGNRYKLHRIMGYTFLGLNLNNTKSLIDHIDRNPSNNNISNLRIVTPRQNSKNNTCKGYTIRYGKYRVRIRVDYKLINIGTFDTEKEAREAYLEAKSKYHII